MPLERRCKRDLMLDDRTVSYAAGGAKEHLEDVLQTMDPLIRRMIRKRLAPENNRNNSIDELTQAALIALSSSITRLKRRTVRGLLSYTRSIVRHKILDHVRYRAGQRKKPILFFDSDSPERASDIAISHMWGRPESSPLIYISLQEMRSRIMKEVDNLCPRYRTVLLLELRDERDVAEIADRLAINRRTASMLLLRAHRSLMGRLRDIAFTGASR